MPSTTTEPRLTEQFENYIAPLGEASEDTILVSLADKLDKAQIRSAA